MLHCLQRHNESICLWPNFFLFRLPNTGHTEKIKNNTCAKEVAQGVVCNGIFA